MTVDPANGGELIFVQGSDGAAYFRYFDQAFIYPWQALGGQVHWDAGMVDLFVVGTDDRVWTRHWNGSAWSAWSQLNPSLALTIPTATDLLTYQLTIAFTVANGPVYSAQWN
jgi:hypothetical protein